TGRTYSQGQLRVASRPILHTVETHTNMRRVCKLHTERPLARRKEVFIQEQYGCVSLTDPFLALQRDEEARGGAQTERPALCLSPMAVLESLMGQCRRMRENMGAQLAAAESRERKVGSPRRELESMYCRRRAVDVADMLQEEKQQLQSLEQEHRKLSAQLKEEREKNKLVVLTLVREYRHLAARTAEDAHRHDDMSTCLQEELSAERLRVQRMEARMEEQLSEMDTERGQLQARLAREEEHNAQLHSENSALSRQLEHLGVGREPKAYASVAVGTDVEDRKAASCQTEPVPAEASMAASKTAPLATAAKPPGSGYAGLSLQKSHSTQRPLLAENGPCGSDAQSSSPPTQPVGVGSRIQATRYKFQASPLEPDQNGATPSSPPSRDLSPSSRDSLAAKQQARNTVTQVLSRFTSPPTTSAVRPGLPHSTSEGGPFPGRLGHHQIGTKTPRGTPPPIPPKKPGLSQTPSPTQPCKKTPG
uniref:Cortactin-binding protein-2 N-terminal domain-containing protein n=1 Tax=Paramormyrops kingsleyae TaxID=1676925 RepID=A0A3B3S723_9TELE